MATINNPSPDDDEVVAITLALRPAGPQTSLAKRDFILSRLRPSIRIGRASKVPAKGFVAAENNAWFDSPVMSRQHAELIFDYGTPKGVFIKDIGSLHGTFHTPGHGTGKESRLEQHIPVRLSSGDLLRFGTDIFRAAATFPPCTLEFHAVQQPMPNHISLLSRVFTIPDDIDDDDEDDDDSVIETAMPPTQKGDVQHGPSIDLTRDETDEVEDHTAHNNLNSDVIDLTSEPDEHSDHEVNVSNNRHSSAFSSIGGQSIPVVFPGTNSFIIDGYAPDLPSATYHSPKPVVGLDDVPDQFSDHSHGPDPYIERDGEEMEDEDDIRLTDSENDSVVTRYSLDETNAASEETDEDEDDGGSSSSVSFNYGWENESLSSGHPDSHDGRPAIWEDDYESADDLPYSDNDTSSSSADSVDSVSNAGSPVLNSPAHALAKMEAMAALTETALAKSSDSKQQSFVTPFLFTAPTQQDTPVTHPREPSPSDAAMFKSHPATIDRTPNGSRAMTLGEKSGKYEFFAAREINRGTIVDQLPPPPISAIRETLGEDTDHRVGSVEADRISHSSFPQAMVGGDQAKPVEKDVHIDQASKVSPPCHNSTSNGFSIDVPMQECVWPKSDLSCSFSGERFINNPRTEDLPNARPERPQSPELDMTSAYTFQLSKMATENRTSQQPRRVGIKDLLMQEANQLEILREQPMPPMPVNFYSAGPIPRDYLAPTPFAHQTSQEHNMKRSFDDAFSDEPVLPHVGDILGDASSQSSDKSNVEPTSKESDISTTSEDMPSEVPVSKTVPPQAVSQLEPVAVATRPDYFQPSKRRRFAQAAACVALGGAAAFTFMVSTAPVL
ncbi:hypothetical protein F4805DRAFT_403898 [Annulohypoxylon moriforme]|nr:hypothetical protein F4805DRAFT_403898 [Annulohypoxylon moriforme]